NDIVGVRRVASEPVTLVREQRDAQGRVVSPGQGAHRNRWLVEKAGFLAERARLARRVRDEQVEVRRLVRARPELKSTFLTLRAAQEFAARRIADEPERVRFLALVREAIAGSIRRGEPLPDVRLREGIRSDDRSTLGVPDKSR
ncbi:MAG TPA: hypothetical protein VKB34_09705, partial [Povalibacter sp.]|nr:hypothetical protein [Povalibacter sp.]